MEIITPVERVLTQVDYVRLTRLLPSVADRDGAEAVQDLLESSQLVAPTAVPADVVTMYSQVLLQGPAGSPYKLTVCYPEHAEPAAGFVSVLSPVGASVLGLRAGDTARWHGPAGRDGRAQVLEVLFQPEATGDYET